AVWARAQGHPFGPTAERGAYPTSDGGAPWRRALFRNDSTAICDLVLDPSNPDVLYAAFWQAQRKPCQLISGGAGGGIFKSSDGGETGTELTRNPRLAGGRGGDTWLAALPARAG